MIVDLEGTLADCTHRLHHIRSGRRKNWGAFFAACHLDTPNPVVLALVKALAKENRLIFRSGRPERTRKASEKWLFDHVGVQKPALYMREDKDRRADAS